MTDNKVDTVSVAGIRYNFTRNIAPKSAPEPKFIALDGRTSFVVNNPGDMEKYNAGFSATSKLTEDIPFGGDPKAGGEEMTVLKGTGVSLVFANSKPKSMGLTKAGLRVGLSLGPRSRKKIMKFSGLINGTAGLDEMNRLNAAAGIKLTLDEAFTIGAGPTAGPDGAASGGGNHLTIKEGAILNANWSNDASLTAILKNINFAGRMLGTDVSGVIKKGDWSEETGLNIAALVNMGSITLPGGAAPAAGAAPPAGAEGSTAEGGPLLSVDPFKLNFSIQDGAFSQFSVKDIKFAARLGKKMVRGSLNSLVSTGESIWTYEASIPIIGDLISRNSPALRLKSGALGFDVTDNSLNGFNGKITADALDAQDQEFAQVDVTVDKLDFTSTGWPITGGADLMLTRPLELLDGKIIIHEGASVKTRLEHNKIDALWFENVFFTVDALQSGGVSGHLTSLMYENADAGPIISFRGGSIDPVSFLDGKLSIGLNDLSFDSGGEFNAQIDGVMAPNEFMSCGVTGTLNSADWLPMLDIIGCLDAPLLPANTWFQMPGDGGLKKLLSLNTTASLYGVPINFAMDLSTQMGLGNTPVNVLAEVCIKDFALDPLQPKLPDISATVAVTGGIWADAQLELTPAISVGIPGVLCAGLDVPVSASGAVNAAVDATGTFDIKDGLSGGELAFNVNVAPVINLNFAPVIKGQFLGNDWSQEVFNGSYSFNDFFNWNKSWSIAFGELHGDASSGSGSLASLESGEASQELEMLRVDKETLPTSDDLNKPLPGTSEGQGLLGDIKHLQNTVSVVAKFMDVITWLQKSIGISLSDIPREFTYDAIANLAKKIKVKPSEVAKIFTDFHKACELAEEAGTLKWFEDQLPKNLSLLPGLIEAYLATVELGYDGAASIASCFGVEDPRKLRARMDREMAASVAMHQSIIRGKLPYMLAGFDYLRATDLSTLFYHSKEDPGDQFYFTWEGKKGWNAEQDLKRLEQRNLQELSNASGRAKSDAKEVMRLGAPKEIAIIYESYRRKEHLKGQFHREEKFNVSEMQGERYWGRGYFGHHANKMRNALLDNS